MAAPADKRPKDKDATLKKASTAIDASLAGDISRKKDESDNAQPLRYDQFRLGVELQVTEKRHEQIASLRRIISLGADPKEMPGLHFRLAELYWEESKSFFFEANRKDDELIAAINAKDVAAQNKAKAAKAAQLAKQDQYAKAAMDEYTLIIQRYKDYERSDEVLYFLGHNLLEMSGDDTKAEAEANRRKGLLAYKRLVDKYPKSRFMPDVYLSFGEYYFNTSKGRREMLEKALEYYKKAAAFPESTVYGFALYKQGWCYFNLSDYPKAMDMWKTVVLYGEFAGASALEKDGGKSGKNTLIREARHDFVRAYSRWGPPSDAKDTFNKLASKPDDLWTMEKELANLYYDDGKDREAAVTYNMLITERPLSPDAPGFQGRIVDCILRTGNKKLTVQQVRRLVKITTEVQKSGNIKTDADRTSLNKAKDLAERTLSNLAVNWHNEAKKTRDEEVFELANEVYGDYLALFPDSAKAYDLRFFWAELLNDNLQRYEKAAEQYGIVAEQDVKRIEGEKGAKGAKPGKPGKWFQNATYNAVLAYDEVIRKAEEKGELKPPAGGDLKKAIELPPLKQYLADACARYLKYLPKGDHRVEISFKLARLYYAYHHYEEAIKRFSDIALNYPDYKFENGDRAGELAANLVLDSYNGLGDFAKVNEWARKFYANEKLASGQFRADLSKIIEQSSFKLVNTLEEKKEFQKAAEEYLKFVQDFPKTEIADTAIYNASTDYYKARLLELAIATRNRLVRQYPKSKFVPTCIFANAEGSEAIGDFAPAAESYEEYVRNYERSLGAAEKAKHQKKGRHKKGAQAAAAAEAKKEEPVQQWEEAKAQQALLNAGVYRDGLGEMKLALKDREKFLELWPENKDAEAVFLSIADLYEKSGAYAKEISHLEQYEHEYNKDPNKVLGTEARILGIYQNRFHNKARVAAMEKRSLDFYSKLYPRQKAVLDATALDPVGRALLAKYETEYDFFAHMKLKWGGMPNPAREFKKSIQEKTKSLEQVTRLFTEVVKMKAADPAICALFKIGNAYQNMADSIANAPMPRGIPSDVADALRDELTKQAAPVREKAADAFAAAVGKSRELTTVNECSTKALKLLRDGLRPDSFPPMDEEMAELKVAAFKTTAQGEGMLTQVQPVQHSVDLTHPGRPDLSLPAARSEAPAANAPVSGGEKPKPEAGNPALKEDEANDLGGADLAPAAKPKESSAPPADNKPLPQPTGGQKQSHDEPEDSL
jgi:tetratricopeptide (TPR) repeat protein